MLLYEEYFNAGVSIYISHITIFTFAALLSSDVSLSCNRQALCLNLLALVFSNGKSTYSQNIVLYVSISFCFEVLQIFLDVFSFTHV